MFDVNKKAKPPTSSPRQRPLAETFSLNALVGPALYSVRRPELDELGRKKGGSMKAMKKGAVPDKQTVNKQGSWPKLAIKGKLGQLGSKKGGQALSIARRMACATWWKVQILQTL